jgi:hypothetical protein
MKQTFLLISALLLTIVFCGCHEVNTPRKDTGFVVLEGAGPLFIVEVDSCEYLFGNWGYATVLTHKGNCKFCLERNKKHPTTNP